MTPHPSSQNKLEQQTATKYWSERIKSLRTSCAPRYASVWSTTARSMFRRSEIRECKVRFRKIVIECFYSIDLTRWIVSAQPWRCGKGHDLAETLSFDLECMCVETMAGFISVCKCSFLYVYRVCGGRDREKKPDIFHCSCVFIFSAAEQSRAHPKWMHNLVAQKDHHHPGPAGSFHVLLCFWGCFRIL